MVKVYYYNRNGVLKLTFNEDPYHMLYGSGEFKNNVWSYQNQYGKLRNFYRGKETYPFSVIINSDDLSDYDALCDVFTDDVVAEEPGYFLINGWKLECYVIKAEHTFYGQLDNVISFEAVSATSTWTRETTTSYDGTVGSSSTSEDYYRDYTYADSLLGRPYDYGYSAVFSGSDTISLSTSGNGFEIMIYGAVTNPVIYLDNYPIQVYVTLDSTQRLHIVSNGDTKTIEILSSTGESTSAFVYRDKDYTPFISLGTSTTLTYGEIHFDFTTIERRSEPSWT